MAVDRTKLWPDADRYISYGIVSGVELCRLKRPDESLIPHTFVVCEGGVITARHVFDIELGERGLAIHGFTYRRDIYPDVMFMRDPECHGLPVGVIPRQIVEGVEIIIGDMDRPNEFTAFRGTLFPEPGYSDLANVIPEDPAFYTLCKEGASGSPVLYRNHVIGTYSCVDPEDNFVGIVTFAGIYMRIIMRQLGIPFREIDI